MPYQRVHLIGGPGSGKSFCACRIAATLGLPAYGLDDLFWDSSSPTWGTRADPAMRDQALLDLVRKDAWVIEGAYHRWVTPSFERAEVVIILNPSVWLRDWRILTRYLRELSGKAPALKRQTLHSWLKLVKWNHTYERNVLAPARVLLASLNKSPVECRTLAQVFAVLTEDRPTEG